MTRVSRRAAQLAVSIALVAALVWWVDLGDVLRHYRGADSRYLFAGLAVAATDRLVMIGKWVPLARVQGVPLGWGRAARVYLASNFASLFLPTSVGADVVRAVAVGRPHGATARVAASIAMERVLGLLGMALVLALAIPLALRSSPGLAPSAALGGALVAAMLVLAGLPFLPGVQRRLRGPLDRIRERRWLGGVASLADAYGAYRAHGRLVAGVGLLSAVEQLAPVALYALVAAALGVSVAAGGLVVAAVFSQLMGRLPVSVSGLGVEEGTAVVLLGLFGLSPAAALSLAIGRRVLETAVFLPGALFWKDVVAAGAGGRPARPTREVSAP